MPETAAAPVAEVVPPADAPPVADAPAPAAAPEAHPADPKPQDKQPEAPKPEPKVDLTSKFVALSKREKALVENERKVKAELAAKQDEIDAKAQKFADLEQLLSTAEKKDYAAIFAKLGTNYEEVTQWYVKGGKEAFEAQNLVSKETKALEAKLAEQDKKLQAKLDEMEKSEKARAEAERAKVIESARIVVADKIKADPKFELLNLSGQAAKVYDTMLEVVASDPDRGSTPEKANELMLEVAEALEAQILAEHQALMKAEKLKTKAEAAAAEEKAKQPAADAAPKPGSVADRKARALAMVEGNALKAPPAVVSTKPMSRADLIAKIAAEMK